MRRDRSSIPGALSIRRGMILTIAVAITTAGPSAVTGAIDEACLARLKKEGPPRWAEAARLLDDIEVVCHESSTTTGTTSDNKPLIQKHEFEWKITWDGAHLRRLVDLKTIHAGVRSIRVINPDYRFQVAKTQGKDASWQVVTGRKAVEPGEFAKHEPHESDYLWSIQSGYRIIGISLDTLMHDKEFRVTSVAYVAGAETDRRVRIEVDYLGGRGSYRQAGASYWVELDPKNGWMIAKGGRQVRDKQMVDEQEVTYQAPFDGVPFPGLMSHKHEDDSGAYVIKRAYKFERPSRPSRQPDEYLLTHYGIPVEALETTSTRPTTRIFLGSLGALGVVVALALVVKSKRKKGNGGDPEGGLAA